MATELDEGVEDTRTITGDEDCLTSETVGRKKKSVIWIFFLFIKKINLKRYV